MQFRLRESVIVIYILSLVSRIECATEVLRPRGVPLSKKIFYDPGKDFTCLDGSQTLPFVLVNDDYCDCDDGSDEPGTAACPHTFFHCSNVGYVERIIPSSRVNDGICDCCDASDEYNSSAKCDNNCYELGERLRREREEHLRRLQEGNQIREQYVEEAKKKKEDYNSQINELRKQKDALEDEKNAKNEIKKAAEEREKEALDRAKAEQDKYKQKKEEEEIIRSEAEEKRNAEIAFKELDLNGDNRVSYTEVQKFAKFDKDGDGKVSEDEAKFFLYAAPDLDIEEFVESAWVIIKPYYLKDKSQPEAAQVETNREETDQSLHDNVAEHESAASEGDVPSEDTEPPTEEEEEEEDDSPPFFPPRDAELMESTTTATPIEDSPPEYDDETKRLIEDAKKARDDFTDVENRYQDLQNKIREIEVSLETDYGPHSEFMPLHGQCFELTDREYIYKLCPFDNASQRSKDGTGETSLGRWSTWVGPEGTKYQKMKFDGGATCWNGPARSVIVNVNCGIANEVTAASEPNRCEYAMDFNTPAICKPSSQPEHHEHVHSEL